MNCSKCPTGFCGSKFVKESVGLWIYFLHSKAPLPISCALQTGSASSQSSWPPRPTWTSGGRSRRMMTSWWPPPTRPWPFRPRPIDLGSAPIAESCPGSKFSVGCRGCRQLTMLLLLLLAWMVPMGLLGPSLNCMSEAPGEGGSLKRKGNLIEKYGGFVKNVLWIIAFKSSDM